ncbi:MAG: hypothetical protein ABJZ55_15370 [Fuerstiella sp.]
MTRQLFKSFILSSLTLLLFMPGSVADQSGIVPSDSASSDSASSDSASSDSGAITTSVVGEDALASRAAKTVVGQGNRKKQDVRGDRLSKETEKKAIEFAQQHQPAMASLVKRLRNKSPEAYDKAIRELSADAVRLTKFEERQPQRFQSELELWKVDSEIRIQLARWTVSGSDRVEVILRRLLTKRQGLRRQRMEVERQRLQARLEAIDEQLQQSTPQSAEDIDREWNKLTRRLRPDNSKTPPRKKTTKDGSKPDDKKSGSKKSQAAASKSAKGEAPK